jgi:predicted DNA-binding protein (MmcQ/YjbR family)
MNVEEYCLSLPSVTEDYPFGDGVAVWKVNGKMFALTQPPGKPDRVNLKCDPTLAIALRQEYHPSVREGYHQNKKHWNTVDLDGKVPDAELKRMIDHSYELVARR